MTVMVAQPCEYAQIHGTVYFKTVKFMAEKFYFSIGRKAAPYGIRFYPSSP